MRILIVVAVLAISSFLFWKAAGSLNPLKMNMIGFAYYSLLIFCMIGSSLAFCGFRDHYMIRQVSDEVIDKTYAILAYTYICFPLVICLFNKFVKYCPTKEMDDTLKKKVQLGRNPKYAWYVAVTLSAVCILSVVYVFCHLGYFPLYEMLTRSADELAFMRIQDTKAFTGNPYIRNLFMLGLTPAVSYLVYIYMRVTKQRKWTVLFGIMFACGILVNTYNFQKSPIIYYLLHFYLIEVALGNVKNFKMLFAVGGIGAALLLYIYYVVFDTTSALFTISSGIGGRIFMSQIGTMFLCVAAFPARHPFLAGTSLPTALATLFGLEDSWVRSGAVVMQLFNPDAVKAGTAGVMNSIFVGEAYANWSIIGVVLAPIYVAILFAVIQYAFHKVRKTPFTVTVYLIFLIQFNQALLGGFIDFLYPVSTTFITMMLLPMGLAEFDGWKKCLPLKKRG